MCVYLCGRITRKEGIMTYLVVSNHFMQGNHGADFKGISFFISVCNTCDSIKHSCLLSCLEKGLDFRGVKCQNDINAELDCYTMLFTLLKKPGGTERKDLRNSEVRM